VTVSENGTLVRDFGSSGYHTLTLYANDTSGNWATPQTVTYLVNFGVEPTPISSVSVPEFFRLDNSAIANRHGLLVYIAKHKP